jgi:hypothetical protein
VARKERKDAAIERLGGLVDAGDWRAARAEAERIAATGDAAEKAAAALVAERLRPGPTAILAFAAGLAFLAVVAAAGLWHR